MTNQQFSDEFDVLLNSFSTQALFGKEGSSLNIEVDEYEKSLFLTQAQEEVVINLYNGKNPYGDSFESSEELRRYLDGLVKTKSYTAEDTLDSIQDKVYINSVFYKLEKDVAFITFEQVTFGEDAGCYKGRTADVYPVTQDEFNRIIRNPFRGPTNHRVLRMDTGNNIVELISKYPIDKYLIKYLAKPSPIILEDLPNGLTIERESEETPCKLNDILHKTILKRAVQLALASKTIFNNKGNSGE